MTMEILLHRTSRRNTTRFAEDRQRLPWRQGEGDAVHSLDHALSGAVVQAQRFDLQESVVHAVLSLGLNIRSSANPLMAKLMPVIMSRAAGSSTQ